MAELKTAKAGPLPRRTFGHRMWPEVLLEKGQRVGFGGTQNSQSRPVAQKDFRTQNVAESASRKSGRG